MNEITQLTGAAFWLPVIFIGLMGLAFFIYAILDGYDLGVGILLPKNSEAQRDTMIASIGPFWDANETWLVLGVGLMLIAFPAAHSEILFQLYLPAALMLIGLILRGVAFDFRAKAPTDQKDMWDKIFKLGSLITSNTQGFMLGSYVMGFEQTLPAVGFSLLSALGVTAAYSLMGASWLVMKTEGSLQIKAAQWGRKAGWFTALGIASVSIVNPLIDPSIFAKWFSGSAIILLMLIPLMCAGLFILIDRYFAQAPLVNDFGNWIPFTASAGIMVLCFVGMAYSFFPYIIPNKLTIWQAASASESLQFILYGAVIVLPTIIGYTAFSYSVFRGKATQLRYY